MLKLDNVSCGYNDDIFVKNISFELFGGENLCIVGPNGCGKSTLLKAIVGIINYKGKITIDNKDLKKLKRKEVASQIAFLSQITSVSFSYSVFETVMLGRYCKMDSLVFSSYTKKDVEFVNECLKNVGIFELKDRSITELSGGELQRVFLARVFAQEPKIIILDEPTNHLDLKHQIELIDYLKKWSNDKEKIVIAVLHDINLALSFADKLLILSNGNQIVYDTKKNILAKNYFNNVYGIDVKKYMLDSYVQWNIL